MLPVRAKAEEGERKSKREREREIRVPVTHGLFETVRFPSCFLAYNTLADWITRAPAPPADLFFLSRIGPENVNVVAHNEQARDVARGDHANLIMNAC